ncbi:hypothetical protein R1sor_020077 [Riccia sorocarpa]|uniref:Uncharacterized protein n=1 Tax=Riccia sorocarpa TaxID=122646 RepID=A0ABD3II04_9MARC
MYQAPVTDQLSRGMKVKHLVQLVSLTVLFTWLLYQLNSSHSVKIANLRTRVDGFPDDTVGFDEPANLVVNADSHVDQLVEVGDEVLSVNLLPKRNIRPSELRELRREENNNAVDELEQVGDEGDDSGEGDGGEDAGKFVEADHSRNLEEIENEGLGNQGVDLGFEGTDKSKLERCKLRWLDLQGHSEHYQRYWE